MRKTTCCSSSILGRWPSPWPRWGIDMCTDARKLCLILTAILVAAALFRSVAARAQESPNKERGVSPGKSYQMGDLDTVNLFNGTMNLRIPLGQPYSVNGALSYA